MRSDKTRTVWLRTLEKFRHEWERPANAAVWSPRLESASRCCNKIKPSFQPAGDSVYIVPTALGA